MEDRARHQAVVSWRSPDGGDPLTQLVSGFSENGVRVLAARWADRVLRPGTEYTVEYVGVSRETEGER